MTKQNSNIDIDGNNALVVFKPSQGETEYQVVLDKNAETLWATELQIAEIFGRDRTVINRHIKNSFKEGELDEVSTSAKIAQVRTEGGRKIQREVVHYNLDVIITVGYRVKSPLATEFRKWATNKLKDYLVKGYTINQNRLDQLKQSIKLIQTSTQELESDQSKEIISVLTDFALGLDILDGYDNQSLEIREVTKESKYKIDYNEAIEAINQLRIKFGGSKLFGNEKDDSFKSSIASIDQTFDGEELYQSIEEKAANLLYFIVKNHSFSDGNKRIAAWLFVWYLNKNKHLYNQNGKLVIENNALASITLMVALSKPDEKELMIRVIINSINKLNQ
ncbi:virulence protein RhuM/Fic/DOC family protein [uncultured Roseivirga sp.]|uniref:virulence protein RhuM/Fic/DOC family protein n=1 Tax=uncultured Roseivirga sp. TaxID=543088 RepID=UPI0030DB1149|tara:strand:+ start:93442 stop:94446 length:1005 start_codon:yes stop_codon:yes gene_type:complete